MGDLLVTWFWRSMIFMFFLGAFLELLTMKKNTSPKENRSKDLSFNKGDVL
jgi:hypothetical protein